MSYTLLRVLEGGPHPTVNMICIETSQYNQTARIIAQNVYYKNNSALIHIDHHTMTTLRATPLINVITYSMGGLGDIAKQTFRVGGLYTKGGIHVIIRTETHASETHNRYADLIWGTTVRPNGFFLNSGRNPNGEHTSQYIYPSLNNNSVGFYELTTEHPLRGALGAMAVERLARYIIVRQGGGMWVNHGGRSSYGFHNLESEMLQTYLRGLTSATGIHLDTLYQAIAADPLIFQQQTIKDWYELASLLPAGTIRGILEMLAENQ